MLCPLPAATARAAVYTLDQLVTRARAQSAAVVAARESLGAAEAQVSEARRLLWPSGELNFGLTGSPTLRCADISGRIDPSETVRENNCIRTNVVDLQRPSSSFSDVLPVHGAAFRLEVRLLQPLYTFGKISAAKNAALAGKEAAALAVDAARADVVLDVVRAYWGVKWARASQATLEDGRARLKEWVARVNQEVERGKSSYTEIDLLRLKLALDTADLSIGELERGGQIALAAVRTITADPQADIDTAEIEARDFAERPVSFYEDAARTHRPEARMLDAAGAASRAGRSLRVAELFPDFGLLGTLNWSFAQDADNPNNAFMSHPNGLGAGLFLVLRAPLDFAERLAHLDRARADERTVEAKRRLALGGIALDIERAYATLVEARKRLTTTAHGERTARSWLGAVEQNLELGTAESRDLVDAARSFFELRIRHLQALMDVNVAMASLERAAGLL